MDERSTDNNKRMTEPFLAIFISPIGTGEIGDVDNPERMEQILSAGNERVARERYFAWQLLDRALHCTIGIGTADAGLSLRGSAWQSEKCHLSISHSGSFVAVALSSDDVGIDIEAVRDDISDGLAARYLTEREFEAYKAIDGHGRAEFFIEKWTAKESVFKCSGKELFTPSAIETADRSVKTCKLPILDTELVLSVCSPMLSAAMVTVLDCDGCIIRNISPFVD